MCGITFRSNTSTLPGNCDGNRSWTQISLRVSVRVEDLVMKILQRFIWSTDSTTPADLDVSLSVMVIVKSQSVIISHGNHVTGKFLLRVLHTHEYLSLHVFITTRVSKPRLDYYNASVGCIY